MKRLLFAAVVALLMLFASCKKSETRLQSATETLSALTQEVLAKTTTQEMKQGYMLLSNQEKEALWKAKYVSILKNDAGKLTAEQLGLVEKLQNFLLANGVDKLFANPKLGEKLIDDNLSALEKAFTKPQQFFLVESPFFNSGFSIAKTTDFSLPHNSTAVANGKNIVTNDVEMDPIGLDGRACGCRYNLGCTGSGNDCVWGGCSQSGGCGIFGTSSCQGNCMY